MDLNPLSGRTDVSGEQCCERCGLQDTSQLQEVTVTPPPVDEENFIEATDGPFACDEHVESVKLNHQCCLDPEYKVHTADADANVVEIVECKSCGETIEYAPRPK